MKEQETPPSAEEQPARSHPGMPILLDLPLLVEQLSDLKDQAEATMAALRLDNNLRLDVREQVAMKLMETFAFKAIGDETVQHTNTYIFGKALDTPEDFVQLCFMMADEFMVNRKK